jgi:signal transduction histidine kinase
MSLFRRIFDSIPSYILIVDKQGRIKGYNALMLGLLGEKTLDGIYLGDVLPVPLARWVEEALSCPPSANPGHGGMLSLESRDMELTSERGDRYIMDVRLHRLLDHDGELDCAVLIMDDVSEQRMAAGEDQPSVPAFPRSSRGRPPSSKGSLARSESLALAERLSVNLAHELSNPLDGIMRYMRLLLAYLADTSEYEERGAAEAKGPGEWEAGGSMPCTLSPMLLAERIQGGLIQMANIIRGLLDVARNDASSFCGTDIRQSIRRTLSTFGDQIWAQNIKVKAEFDESIPAILNVDVEQISMNMIRNAIQAMPSGGTLSVNARMLSPQLFEVRFSDTGPGIPGELQKMIFRPFFTTKGEGSNFGRGVGLGLSISQEIAERYNGSINVESEVGKGTTFVVRLPIAESGERSAECEEPLALGSRH